MTELERSVDDSDTQQTPAEFMISETDEFQIYVDTAPAADAPSTVGAAEEPHQ